jgi:UDP-glucose 4-epimerase
LWAEVADLTLGQRPIATRRKDRGVGRAYLVTGGAGFIGGHVVARLLEDPAVDTVVAFDDLSNSDMSWPARLGADPRYRFVRGDVLDTEALIASLRGIERVVHLASSVDMRRGMSDISFDLRQCALATLSVLEAMRRAGCHHIVFSSSSTVYGEPSVVPTPEDCGPYAPISLYGAGKLAAEGLLSAFCHLYGFTAHVFRFGNVVGGGMNHGVIYDFLVKLREDSQTLEVLGDGKQRKNYFLVEDCIAGILHCSERLDAGYHVVNLGNAGTTTVATIAEIVTGELGLTGTKIRYTGGERGWPGDVPVVEFNLSQAAALGWSAKTDSDGSVRIAARRLIDELGLTRR